MRDELHFHIVKAIGYQLQLCLVSLGKDFVSDWINLSSRKLPRLVKPPPSAGVFILICSTVNGRFKFLGSLCKSQ